jgi:hypothetical protein
MRVSDDAAPRIGLGYRRTTKLGVLNVPFIRAPFGNLLPKKTLIGNASTSGNVEYLDSSLTIICLSRQSCQAPDIDFINLPL